MVPRNDPRWPPSLVAICNAVRAHPDKPDAPALARHVLERSPVFQANKRVAFVVTGDEGLGAVAARSLARAGLLAVRSSGAEDCIRRIRSHIPTLFVIEEHLADGSGWELVRVLKRLSSTAHVPVLGLGKMVGLEDVARALYLGCDGFVAKPCSEDAVLEEAQVLVDEPAAC